MSSAEQQGAAVAAAKRIEIALVQQVSAVAEVDQLFIQTLQDARLRTVEGSRRLRDIGQQIEQAVAGAAALDTPAGKAEFQRFLIAKFREIRAVVAEVRADDIDKKTSVNLLADEYKVHHPADRSS